MAPIRTLYSESTDAKNFQEHGYKLDSRERELESQCNELLLKLNFSLINVLDLEMLKLLQKCDLIIKLLEEKLSLTQKYSSKKDSEIMFLKAKLVNIKSKLDSKVSELEHLKSEDISVPMVGGDSEKNMSKSNNISIVSEPSKNLNQYFNLQKSMLGLFLKKPISRNKECDSD
ncbi:hypothetical protein F8M41_002611 [Gigaspora margarita]|uniref:Uncharacterized protein n=1 Tax=Gigaspora margarita TaxID=4874 RepID=A0A8H3XE19_GIGMA|nr:hypothetical protein F8M41_002611 [Gigaspora margarita]